MTRIVPPAADLLVLALAAVLLFVGLGSNSLQNEDEARYALVAQEMLARGDWIEPTVQGAPWWNKAPLRVWANAALGAVFDFGPWTVRLPSAVAALGVVAFLLWLGRLWGDAAVGRWTALIVVTSTWFLYNHGARTGEMESFLLFFWIATLTFATKARDDERWALAAAAALGMVGMAKHATYMVPVAGLLMLFWWRSGILFRLRARTWIAGALIVAVIVVPWHLVMALRHADFLATYFGDQVAGRVDRHAADGASPLFALRVLKDALFPWVLWIPVLIFVRPRAVEGTRGIDLVLAVWAAGMVAATAASRLDLPWYVLPAVPALALWTARRLATLRVPPLAAAAVAGLLLLSPTNVFEFDVIHTRAMWGGIGVQVLGRLQGIPVWWLQTACALLALVVVLVPRNVPAPRRVFWALVVWGAFAVAHAAAPLRDAFTPGPLDVVAAEIRSTGRDVVVLHGGDRPPSDLIAYALRRAGVDHVNRHVSADDVEALAATRWILGPTEDVRRVMIPDPRRVRAEWAAIPPDLSPAHTVPR